MGVSGRSRVAIRWSFGGHSVVYLRYYWMIGNGYCILIRIIYGLN